MHARPSSAPEGASILIVAAGLALAAAVSLGLARFSYALLLPPMQADLGWSYLAAGSMNTFNAAGYLAGALLAPRWITRFEAPRVLFAGGIATALLLAGHGMVTGEAVLFALRAATGVASAAVFVSGGLIAARLSARLPAAAGPHGTNAGPSPGLILGIYYGGTGLGIVFAALVVPTLAAMPIGHAWQRAWTALGGAALVATLVTALATRRFDPVAASLPSEPAPFERRRFAFGLAAYFLFGLGYIGYMTFIVTLLREQGLGRSTVVGFYALLGLAVVGSSFAWAGLLQRHRGGGAMRLLNALLALATLLPVLGSQPALVYASALLFGGVFLSVVASTTALVRLNAPPGAWPAGIAAFTTVFAVGQIIGPAMVGWLADGSFGLRGGLACSAGVLLLGALLATGQKATGEAETPASLAPAGADGETDLAARVAASTSYATSDLREPAPPTTQEASDLYATAADAVPDPEASADHPTPDVRATSIGDTKPDAPVSAAQAAFDARTSAAHAAPPAEIAAGEHPTRA